MFANVTWPSLLYDNRAHAWWMIIICIAIEFLVLRRSLKTTPVRALGIIVAINVFSAIIGAIPFIPWENDFPFDHAVRLAPLVWAGLSWASNVDQVLGLGTFNCVSWVITILFATILSTLLEGLLLFTAFYRVAANRRCLYLLPVANLASAIFTYVSIELFWPR